MVSCLKHARMRWISLSNFMALFGKNSATVILYLDDKSPVCKATASMWISPHALNHLVAKVDIHFKYSQYEGLPTTQLRLVFDPFLACTWNRILLRGTRLSQKMAGLSDEPTLCKEEFPVLLSDILNLLTGLGSWLSAISNVFRSLGVQLKMFTLWHHAGWPCEWCATNIFRK